MKKTVWITVCIGFLILLVLLSCTNNRPRERAIQKKTELTREERIERIYREFKERGFETDSAYSEEDWQQMLDTMNVAEAERMLIWWDELNLYPDEPNMHPVEGVPEEEVVYDEQMGLTYLAMNHADRDLFIKELRKISEITDKSRRDTSFQVWCRKYGFKVKLK
ncbi:MAG: hypothetical protein LUH22_09480 [Bacteroides sp.]|nr:hypothetical protein [Bacteroides sp.]